MSTSGPDIYTALLSVRRLHQQVALLLRTADAHLIGEAGFRALCGATALADGTASIHHPDKWLPNTAFRYYQRQDAEDIVLFASVIMCPRGPEHHKRRWVEPLVSAGWLRLAEPATKWNQYGWANMIVWTDVPRDGTLSRWVAPGGQPHDNGSLEQRCLAVPLVEITTTEALVDRVLEPVIASLEQERPTTRGSGGDLEEPTP